MKNRDQQILEDGFYRLRSSCRSTPSTRIGECVVAAKSAGWPGEVRGGILQPKKKFPACGGGMRRTFALRRDPQPSVTPHCPTSAPKFTITGRSDTRGCDGRLRSSMRSKLRHIGRRRRRLQSPAANGLLERQQASQHFSQRRKSSLFEPTDSSGTKTAIDKNIHHLRAN
jgi:hypothetical protein